MLGLGSQYLLFYEAMCFIYTRIKALPIRCGLPYLLFTGFKINCVHGINPVACSVTIPFKAIKQHFSEVLFNTLHKLVVSKCFKTLWMKSCLTKVSCSTVQLQVLSSGAYSIYCAAHDGGSNI